jgi:hypothetical protein
VTLRDQVVAAFETDDDLTINQLGWWPVWEALATWWTLPQKCTRKNMVPYAKLIGGEDPAKVIAALEALATDKFRPSPSQIRGQLHPTDGDESKVDVGRGRDVYLRDEPVQAVAEALQAGEEGCTCGGWHSSRFHPDASGVLRCRTCHGLEDAQVYAAEDAAERRRKAMADHDVDGYAESVRGRTKLLTPDGARA